MSAAQSPASSNAPLEDNLASLSLHESGPTPTPASSDAPLEDNLASLSLHESGPTPIPFATHRDDSSRSLLSVLAGAHSVGAGIFGFLDQRHACALRLVCVEMRDAVAAAPWMATSRIYSSVRRWRRCFPLARAADVAWRIKSPLYNADFKYLRNLRWLNLTCSDGTYVFDSAFAHLEGLETLFISAFDARITDRAFFHLRGIKRLYMSGLKQLEITNLAFSYLAGVEVLYMVQCDQPTISDDAFAHLRGVQELWIDKCTQEAITDRAFTYLSGIRILHMDNCTQAGITAAAFDCLEGVQEVSTEGCREEVQRAASRAVMLSRKKSTE